MRKLAYALLTFSVVVGFSTNVFSQCKTFTKNHCTPKLSPYIYNGQLNSAVLNEGDVAELMLTFYSNQDYRIVVCAADEIQPVEFSLKDNTGNVIFTNTEHDMIDYWDFHTNSTQQLRVEVSIPEDDNTKEHKSGCVSILIGFMDSE